MLAWRTRTKYRESKGGKKRAEDVGQRSDIVGGGVVGGVGGSTGCPECPKVSRSMQAGQRMVAFRGGKNPPDKVDVKNGNLFKGVYPGVRSPLCVRPTTVHRLAEPSLPRRVS